MTSIVYRPMINWQVITSILYFNSLYHHHHRHHRFFASFKKRIIHFNNHEQLCKRISSSLYRVWQTLSLPFSGSDFIIITAKFWSIIWWDKNLAHQNWIKQVKSTCFACNWWMHQFVCNKPIRILCKLFSFAMNINRLFLSNWNFLSFTKLN